MSDFVKNFRKKNSPQFTKYKKWIEKTDWSKEIVEKKSDGTLVPIKYYYIKDIKYKGEVLHEGKESEYKLQDKIVNSVLERLEYFVKHTEGDIGKVTSVDYLIKNMRNIIEYHLKRTNQYISSTNFLEDKVLLDNDEDKKTQSDLKSEEIEFDNILYRNQTKINDRLNKLNLDRDVAQSILELYDNQKAPLSMREAIEGEFPDVKKRVEGMGIDFTSKPKNEMLINIENPPEWNEDKHYFEQDKKTLQFYVDEYKKINRGITIDGVYITPWLYCHLNHFTTKIPVPIKNDLTGKVETKDIAQNPPLRDNEWFIIQDNYEVAKDNDKVMFLCATRRAAKTTLIASHLHWKALTTGGQLIVAGGSTKDLGQIEGNFRVTMTKCHPAFRVPNTSNNWTKKVVLGVKKKNSKNISSSTLEIVNLDSGGEKSSEKLAGFTPSAFVLDECMKNPFKDQFNAAKPAFDSPTGKRLVPILSGTGSSNDALTKDAFQILQNPETQDVLEMNWDALERNVPEGYITWKRRKFATFLPGQMSAKVGMVKKDIAIWEYLGIERTDKLDKVRIKVTDWKHAKEVIEKDRDKISKDRDSLIKETVYYPIDPEEIFLSGKTSPFPVEPLKRYKQKLIDEGDLGQKVFLEYDEKRKQILPHISDKEYPDFPFGGGFFDAPITIYEPPLENITFEFYVAGHDSYKQEQSSSDSLGSFSIIRRDNGKLVASYHSRPDPKEEFNRQGLLLLQMYKSPVFMENEDMGLKEYTDRLDETDNFIVKSIDLSSDISLDAGGKRKYGWTPTAKTKSFFLGILIRTIKKTEDYIDDDGNIRSRYGFEKIKDIRMLDEMINYNDDGNFDTVISLMSAYAYDFYLTANYGAPERPLTTEELKAKERLLLEKKNKRERRKMFPDLRRSKYPKNRRR